MRIKVLSLLSPLEVVAFGQPRQELESFHGSEYFLVALYYFTL